MNEINRITTDLWSNSVRPELRQTNGRISEVGTNTDRPATDLVEFSSLAIALANTNRTPPIRMEKVEQIRAMLANGTYDVDSKLGLIADRLAADLI